MSKEEKVGELDPCLQMSCLLTVITADITTWLCLAETPKQYKEIVFDIIFSTISSEKIIRSCLLTVYIFGSNSYLMCDFCK